LPALTTLTIILTPKAGKQTLQTRGELPKADVIGLSAGPGYWMDVGFHKNLNQVKRITAAL
jgi:hypothetical protein